MKNKNMIFETLSQYSMVPLLVSTQLLMKPKDAKDKSHAGMSRDREYAALLMLSLEGVDKINHPVNRQANILASASQTDASDTLVNRSWCMTRRRARSFQA